MNLTIIKKGRCSAPLCVWFEVEALKPTPLYKHFKQKFPQERDCLIPSTYRI